MEYLNLTPYTLVRVVFTSEGRNKFKQFLLYSGWSVSNQYDYHIQTDTYLLPLLRYSAFLQWTDAVPSGQPNTKTGMTSALFHHLIESATVSGVTKDFTQGPTNPVELESPVASPQPSPEIDDAALDLFIEAVEATPSWCLRVFQQSNPHTLLDPSIAVPAHREQLRKVLEAFLEAALQGSAPVQSIAPAPAETPEPTFKPLDLSGNGFVPGLPVGKKLTPDTLQALLDYHHLSPSPKGGALNFIGATLSANGLVSDWIKFAKKLINDFVP